MNTETLNQAYIFVIFILNGLLIGLLFDMFRIMRKSFKTSNLVTYIEDTLFWILTAFIILYSLFFFNNGQFRLYIFIGIFLGITIYMLFLSKLFIDFTIKILDFIKRVFIKLYQIITYPLKIIYRFINFIFIKPLHIILMKFHKFMKKICNLDKKSENLQKKEGF